MKLTGPGGLLGDVTKRVFKAGLEGEMDGHLGYRQKLLAIDIRGHGGCRSGLPPGQGSWGCGAVRSHSTTLVRSLEGEREPNAGKSPNSRVAP